MHAEAAGQLQAERADSSARRHHISQVIPIERVRHVEQAIEVRTGRLGAELLTHPAPWMLDDIADRIAELDNHGTAIAPGRLAAGYPAVVIFADRARLDPHDLTLDQARHLAIDANTPDLDDALADVQWRRSDPPRPTLSLNSPTGTPASNTRTRRKAGVLPSASSPSVTPVTVPGPACQSEILWPLGMAHCARALRSKAHAKGALGPHRPGAIQIAECVRPKLAGRARLEERRGGVMCDCVRAGDGVPRA